MNPQTLLVASSTESNITAWDIQTGTALAVFKTNACPPHGLSLLGRDHFIACQLGKPALHVWTWHKDQIHLRSFAPEPITALACTQDGALCAAGGSSGAMYLWETSTGRLLRSWPAHYKRVTCIAFSDAGTELITGSEDTLVAAWLVVELLESDGGALTVPNSNGSRAMMMQPSSSPLHSWNDHTMPVSGLAVGAGGCNAIVVSASADRTIKIRSLASGGLLKSVALPAPLCSLLLDPAEHAVYVGSANGPIFQVSLVERRDEGSLVDSVQKTDRRGGPWSSIEAPRSHANPTDSAPHNAWATMQGHAKAVTCLQMTGDAAMLVSGSDDGSVRVWDVRTRQLVRTLASPVKGPVSALIVLDRPEHLTVGMRGGARRSSAASPESIPGVSGGKKGPKRMQPVAQFSKYPGVSNAARPWEGPLVVLDGSGIKHTNTNNIEIEDDGDGDGSAWYLDSSTGREGVGRGVVAHGGEGLGGAGGADVEMVAALKEENARLKEQASKAMELARGWAALNAELLGEMSK